MSLIVRVEKIGKRYRLGGLHPGYVTLREVVGKAVLAPFRRRAGRAERAPAAEKSFWALRDVSFEVAEGEVVGIVGKNGAGKSTLLKILSRVTKPTEGSADIYGRVGSLLEVGTGFHPDLTGRENIFLNGAILGMRREEITRKFDEIVSFAEVERHIDTPVKWYSSGMYLRLAFSVAAHLEPEVLIMDEVLAVGDAAFQQKCLDKLRDIRASGHTIFFVSHNLHAVTRLCGRALLLEGGRIAADASPREVVGLYLSEAHNAPAAREWSLREAPGDGVARLLSVRAFNDEGITPPTFDSSRAIGIEITYEVLEQGHAPAPGIDVYNDQELHLFSSREQDAIRAARTGTHTSIAWIPGHLLPEGNLLVHITLTSHGSAGRTHAHERNALALHIADPPEAAPANGFNVGPTPGAMRPRLEWTSGAGDSLSN